MEKSELVVELGFEEFPAWMLESSARQFAQALLKALELERLPASLTALWYTPRRIIVGLEGIDVRQEDLFETIIGPPKSVAFDAQGAPTKAALAFAKKNAVTLRRVKTVQTPKGEYLSAVRRVRGERTRDILKRLIPAAIAQMQFPKAMYWSADKFRFARPLRWIVALFQGRVVRFPIADVTSSNLTVGHRLMGKRKIPVSTLSMLRQRLAENGVVVDPAERETRIREGLEREAASRGGCVNSDPELLLTVANLNECPTVISGSFESRFLSLPQEILVTVMREHQKYFSLLDHDGQLLPAFLTAINLEAPNVEKIRAGHERVLRARLADAAFFWETDRKVRLMERQPALQNVLFQEKLGSYYDKTRRILSLLPKVAEVGKCAGQLPDLEAAANLCKCDLVTEMVKEFTDLQGVVGGLYARAEGYPEPVWRAIYEHYLPRTTASASPSTRLGSVLAIVDRLDTICGCFSAGLIPSGSRDPFALRRQGNGLLKILFDQRISASLEQLLDCSLALYPAASADLAGELKNFFEGRLRFLMEEAGYAYDCINAALAAGFDDPLDAIERVSALQAMHGETDFLSVASNFKRIVNILAQGGSIADKPDRSRLSEPEEKALFERFHEVRPKVQEARRNHDYVAVLRHLASMRLIVDAFFDNVLVMAEDPALRGNRLALLKQLAQLFLGVADVSQIVLEKNAP